MDYINNIIQNKKQQIIQEGVIKDIFKKLIAILCTPYIIVLSILIIAAPFFIINNKIDKNKLEKVIKNNPEFVKNINKISKNISDIFIKSINKKDYFKYMNIINSDDLFIKSRKNNSVEIGCEIIKLNSMIIFRDITGCDSYEEYCNKCNHENFDEEPECKDLEKLFKEIEFTISIINKELKSKYNGIRISLTEDINYDFLFTYLGIFGHGLEDPTISIYIKCNVDSTNIADDIKKELDKKIMILKPLIERRLK